MTRPAPAAIDAETLAARIPDGASVALANDLCGSPTAVARALMARGARDLHLIGLPTLGFAADMLIGAGCVAIVETAAVSLGEYGPAPRFAAAVAAGAIELRDATCPAIHAGLQAAEKGLPFMPLRGVIGSDLVANRPDWKVAPNPFAEDGHEDPVLLLPPVRPDIALFHAPKADRHGNVWIGVRRELMLAAHASATTLCTVEEIVDADFFDDKAMAAGTIPALYIGAVAAVPGGALPLALPGWYEADEAALAAYVASAGKVAEPAE